jgi:hypothetical protein
MDRTHAIGTQARCLNHMDVSKAVGRQASIVPQHYVDATPVPKIP